jgi:hypothetical protein
MTGEVDAPMRKKFSSMGIEAVGIVLNTLFTR